jgi:hypothetical protein
MYDRRSVVICSCFSYLEVAGEGRILDHSTPVANIVGFAARSVKADFVRLVEQIIAPLFLRNRLEHAP